MDRFKALGRSRNCKNEENWGIAPLTPFVHRLDHFSFRQGVRMWEREREWECKTEKGKKDRTKTDRDTHIEEGKEEKRKRERIKR